jgi:nicotinamide-nucleotide amidase
MALTEHSTPIAAVLVRNKQTVAVAESSTGGLLCASLLAVPGASAYFKGGSAIYTLASRKHLLGMRREDVEGLEPMTEAMALAFAKKARLQLDATWGIAELGIAGPTGAPYGQPPGTSVIGIDGPCPLSTTVHTGSHDREENMWEFTRCALALFSDALNHQSS